MQGYSHIFGPVPSRRLGLSLGIDLVPLKTCTLDCVYCELGRTAHPVSKRAEYVKFSRLSEEICHFFANFDGELDFITLSGSGEPTLNPALPRVIELLRRSRPDTPIALLTNGTLFSDPQVRREAGGVDLILPSLDAVSEQAFKALNRPAPGLDNQAIIAGLQALRQEFKGRIYLEILLARGYNDSPEEIERLIAAAAGIVPDKIQLNTVVRPGTLSTVKPVSQDFLRKLAPRFRPAAEIIAPFSSNHAGGSIADREQAILETLRRRPCTRDDLEQALGLKPAEAIKLLEKLTSQQLVSQTEHLGRTYYGPAESEN